jgi:hypothetical protein
MRRLLLACVAWAGCIAQSHSQLVLQPGESFTFDFNAFTFVGSPGLGIPGTTQVFFTPSGGGPPIDAWRFEAFENSLSEAPILNTTSFISPIGLGSAWQGDLQGVVRFTALTQPFTLDSLNASILLPDRSLYEQIAVVPEPGSFTLLALGVLTSSGWIIWRRRRS